MTNTEREKLDHVRLNQAKTTENIEHITAVLASMTDALAEQSKHLHITANDVKHIKDTIDSIPSVVAIQKDVEMLKVCRTNMVKTMLGLVVASIIGFVSYMFTKVQ